MTIVAETHNTSNLYTKLKHLCMINYYIKLIACKCTITLISSIYY